MIFSRYDDYAEWDISDVKESVGIDTAGSVQKEYEKPEGDISVYEGFDRFCEKENIRDDEEEVFYGAAFDEFNREWQGIALEGQLFVLIPVHRIKRGIQFPDLQQLLLSSVFFCYKTVTFARLREVFAAHIDQIGCSSILSEQEIPAKHL